MSPELSVRPIELSQSRRQLRGPTSATSVRIIFPIIFYFVCTATLSTYAVYNRMVQCMISDRKNAPSRYNLFKANLPCMIAWYPTWLLYRFFKVTLLWRLSSEVPYIFHIRDTDVYGEFTDSIALRYLGAT